MKLEILYNCSEDDSRISVDPTRGLSVLPKGGRDIPDQEQKDISIHL